MLRRLLIANRGEIAVRVIRACQELGIHSIAVYSDADRPALHVQLADERHRLGPSPPAESYLNVRKLVEIAQQTHADAVHPGYGFLAENANFARACEDAGLAYVGPSSRTLELTGNKLACRRKLAAAGVPVLPGSSEVLDTVEVALSTAERIGWPVLVKSVFGGGGRGIRIVHTAAELREEFASVRREAQAAFGRFGVYVERFLQPARHIEIQILAGADGKTVHLGERECSVQRRYQKLVELAPSSVVDDKLRRRLGDAALTAAWAVGYRNAGTVEFLFGPDGRYHAIEINARLQVEHPVTEAVTGVDLVKEQLRIAAGESEALDGVELRGAAIECRINAEDPLNDFAPSGGTVLGLHLPAGPGVRIDTALYEGYEIPTYYDSLVAKLIASGRDFTEARVRALRALHELRIDGVATTRELQGTILSDQAFATGALSTDFLVTRRIMASLARKAAAERKAQEKLAVALAAAYLSSRARAPEAPRGRSSWAEQPIETSRASWSGLPSVL
jgi:acetyl-CoA carboxylase biotin carboxylase subunit